MKNLRHLSIGFATVILCAIPVAARASPLTYTFLHDRFVINPSTHPEWKEEKMQWTFLGQPAIAPKDIEAITDDAELPAGWERRKNSEISDEAIATTIREQIAPALERMPGKVSIQRSASGVVSFSGSGLTGQKIDMPSAIALTKKAMTDAVNFIALPVSVTQPAITVDPELSAMGIREVVSIGESAFPGSPKNRQHNIKVGMSKFNGHLIPKNAIFSFNEVLGPVNQKMGYVKELVIQGDKTLPDYGGGLCQVSSTAYRGVWEYGFPIVQRKNHSYAVSYYSPQGTDATIYPPNVDMKFINDSPGALLIQTLITNEAKAYFIYYGTKDARTTEIFGPYISDRKAAPKEELLLYGTDIPPGTRKRVSEKHDGLSATWYRTIQTPKQEKKTERVFSKYEIRQLTYEVGIDPLGASGASMAPLQ